MIRSETLKDLSLDDLQQRYQDSFINYDGKIQFCQGFVDSGRSKVPGIMLTSDFIVLPKYEKQKEKEVKAKVTTTANRFIWDEHGGAVFAAIPPAPREPDHRPAAPVENIAFQKYLFMLAKLDRTLTDIAISRLAHQLFDYEESINEEINRILQTLRIADVVKRVEMRRLNSMQANVTRLVKPVYRIQMLDNVGNTLPGVLYESNIPVFYRLDGRIGRMDDDGWDAFLNRDQDAREEWANQREAHAEQVVQQIRARANLRAGPEGIELGGWAPQRVREPPVRVEANNPKVIPFEWSKVDISRLPTGWYSINGNNVYLRYTSEKQYSRGYRQQNAFVSMGLTESKPPSGTYGYILEEMLKGQPVKARVHLDDLVSQVQTQDQLVLAPTIAVVNRRVYDSESKAEYAPMFYYRTHVVGQMDLKKNKIKWHRPIFQQELRERISGLDRHCG